MEVKAFTDSLFIPLMLEKTTLIGPDPDIIACDIPGILNYDGWEMFSFGPAIPDLVKIEFTFDGDINNPETFDVSKAVVYSIVATRPAFFDYDDSDELSNDQNTNMLKNIINCFSGTVIELPKQFRDLFEDLLTQEWSYRIATSVMIVPVAFDGQFSFSTYDYSV